MTLSIVPWRLIGTVGLLRLRILLLILLLIRIVALLRLLILPLIRIVVLLRRWVLLLIRVVALLHLRILPWTGIAVHTRDPPAILIVSAPASRRRGRSVRITWRIVIAGTVDVAGIVSVSISIRSAIAQINASTVISTIDGPPVRT